MIGVIYRNTARVTVHSGITCLTKVCSLLKATVLNLRSWQCLNSLMSHSTSYTMQKTSKLKIEKNH